MKNVLFFTHSLSGGGAEKTVRQIARHINSHDYGYKVHVCVVYDDPAYHGEVDDLHVLKIKSQPSDLKLKKGFNVLRQIAEMKKLKKDLKIDTCVSFLPGADIINVLSGCGEKKLVSVRNKDSKFFHSFLQKIYVKTSYALCDKIIAVTEVVRNDCIDFFGAPPKKVITIHNAIKEVPVDDSATNKRQDIDAFIEGHRVIINIGRLTEQKGQEHLIRSFSKALKDHPDIRLLILGEGPLHQKLQETGEKLGIAESVMLAGNVINPSKYLKKSEIFVLSSEFEGMPNVLLEAMQCGLPCISTECGAREFVAPATDAMKATTKLDKAEFGILVPVCGTKSGEIDKSAAEKESILADAICMMLDDDEMRKHYSEKALECIVSYNIDNICDKWVDAMEKC